MVLQEEMLSVFQKHSPPAFHNHLLHFVGLVFTFNTTGIAILNLFSSLLTFWVSPNLDM